MRTSVAADGSSIVRSGAATAAQRRRSPSREREVLHRRHYNSFRRGSRQSWCSCRCTPLCTAFGALIISSIGLVSGGCWLFVLASEANREQSVGDYEKSIRTWNEGRAAFAKLNVSVAWANQSGVKPVNLRPNFTRDALHDYEEEIGAEKLPKYKALVFRARAPSDFVSSKSISFEDQPLRGPGGHGFFMPPEKFEVMVSDAELGETRLEVGPYSLLKVEAKPTHELYPSEHACKPRGHFHMGSCWVLIRLERVCVQIKRTQQVAAGPNVDAANASWVLAPRSAESNTSYGCEFSEGKWDAAVYGEHPSGRQTVAEILSLAEEPPLERPLVPWSRSIDVAANLARLAVEDLRFEVRSRDDPFLRSLELTEGRLDFGMSASDQQEWGRLLLIFGCVLALPPFVALCLRRCLDRLEMGKDRDYGHGIVDEVARRGIGRRYADFEEDEDTRQC